ncbi:hypothetical protein [Fusobacterium mortiferum]|nr:hypothetical protein [Fusobacterium mortiferum]RGN00624.1 hypothetical protein DXB84_01705 [Fusobacterium mortiferum]
MKKYIITFLLGIAVFFFFKLTSNPQKILLNHLEKKYNKEFIIAFDGERSDGRSKWYEAEIYPKELEGTTREYDKYYWAKGFVEQGKGGDTYGKVLLNESANEFYLPKLKELFGENVLPVLDLKGAYDSTDYEEEMKLRKLFEKDSTGKYLPLSGGIYIFGRVESDKDREWYRKQIYEFVQFMKQTGTFEYVALPINVLDERVLSKEFQENIKLQQKLVDMGLKNKRKNVEVFRKERRRLMNELPKNLTPYVKLEEINKTEIRNSVKWSVYNNLLTTGIYSPKYVESNSLEEEYGIKNYDKLSDVSFTYEEY